MYSIEEMFDNQELSQFVHKNPGDRNFVCEYCGVYTAGRPFCNKCEEDEPLSISEQEMMGMLSSRIGLNHRH